MHRLALLVILLVPIMAQSQESTAKAPWDSLKFFVGHWQGTLQGQPGQGKGERYYEFVLKDKFHQLRKRKKFVFRQFHVEGFVNEYVEQEGSVDGKTLIFVTDRIENIPDGWRARETYKIVSPDEYAEVFELAPPQKDFELYSESRWKRVK